MMHFGVFWAIVYKAYRIKVEKQFCVPIYWLVMCPYQENFSIFVWQWYILVHYGRLFQC